jgi:hypothetical protein
VTTKEKLENEIGYALQEIWRMRLTGADVGPEAGEWFTMRVRADASATWHKVVSTRTIGDLVEFMQILANWLPKGVEVEAARCFDYNKKLRKYHAQTFLITQTGVEKHHLKPADLF